MLGEQKNRVTVLKTLFYFFTFNDKIINKTPKTPDKIAIKIGVLPISFKAVRKMPYSEFQPTPSCVKALD
mgnify:CR=1 FL=1